MIAPRRRPRTQRANAKQRLPRSFSHAAQSSEAAMAPGPAGFRVWLSACSPFLTEHLAAVGFDWLLVDAEHSAVDLQTMVQMFQAISHGDTMPLARVPWNDPVHIKRVLDSGAYGVVVPWVNSREEAEKAVSACRYPPDG